MTQEEHILCEIEEFKIELQRSKEMTKRLEKKINDKEEELYLHRVGIGLPGTLFGRLDFDGYMTDNCNNICEIVQDWLPPRSGGRHDLYEDGWNDYRNEVLRNIK